LVSNLSVCLAPGTDEWLMNEPYDSKESVGCG
jgi:hypothetical protein